jgi:hypothetical protein
VALLEDLWVRGAQWSNKKGAALLRHALACEKNEKNRKGARGAGTQGVGETRRLQGTLFVLEETALPPLSLASPCACIVP